MLVAACVGNGAMTFPHRDDISAIWGCVCEALLTVARGSNFKIITYNNSNREHVLSAVPKLLILLFNRGRYVSWQLLIQSIY